MATSKSKTKTKQQADDEENEDKPDDEEQEDDSNMTDAQKREKAFRDMIAKRRAGKNARSGRLSIHLRPRG